MSNILSETYIKLLNNIILPIGDKAFGGDYIKHLKEWNQFDLKSSKELAEIQKKRLFKILTHAQETVPFYKNKIDKSFTDPYQTLKKLSVLSKTLLTEKREELVSNQFSVEELSKNFSSGSTGVQSYSYSLPKDVFLNQAIQRHWFLWTGYRQGDPVMQFGISPQRTLVKKLKDIFFNATYVNAFSISEEDCEQLYLKLKKKKIQFMIGYPSAIYQLAKWMKENEKKHQIKSIISLGDKLFSHYEKLFKDVFNNPLVMDTYGCAEGFLIAARLDHPYYYISSPHVVVEIVDDEGNEVKDGEMGHVLLTSLTNYAQPFLRYKLGDLAVRLPKNEYPESLQFNYPLLKRIVGRETDAIHTPTKISLTVHSFTGIFEYYEEIIQFKVIQTSSDQLKIEYISDTEIETIIKEINEKLCELTQNSMDIDFERVDKISAMKSGKPQIIEKRI